MLRATYKHPFAFGSFYNALKLYNTHETSNPKLLETLKVVKLSTLKPITLKFSMKWSFWHIEAHELKVFGLLKAFDILKILMALKAQHVKFSMHTSHHIYQLLSRNFMDTLKEGFEDERRPKDNVTIYIMVIHIWNFIKSGYEMLKLSIHMYVYDQTQWICKKKYHTFLQTHID